MEINPLPAPPKEVTPVIARVVQARAKALASAKDTGGDQP